MNAYHAAQKIKREIDRYYGLDKGPECNRAVAWGKRTVIERGWDPDADAQVAMEGEYEWTLDLTGGDIRDSRLTRLMAELRGAGFHFECYSGWLLNIYKPAR